MGDQISNEVCLISLLKKLKNLMSALPIMTSTIVNGFDMVGVDFRAL